MIDPAIITYIKTQLHAGSSQKDISIALGKQGWSALSIAEHFAALEAPPVEQAAPTLDPAPVPSPLSQPVLDDNPLAYERLHPKNGVEIMPVVMGQTTITESPKRFSIGAFFTAPSTRATILSLVTLAIGLLLYIGVYPHITPAMISTSLLFAAQALNDLSFQDLMPLSYILPIPIGILCMIFLCRYRGVRIAARESHPYLGFFYGTSLYFAYCAVLLAITKIGLDFYITKLPLPTQAELATRYFAYYFSVGGLLAVGLLVLCLLLIVAITNARLEELTNTSLGEYVFRYVLIVIVCAGSLYLTNVLYQPAILSGRTEACLFMYDPGLRLDCKMQVKG